MEKELPISKLQLYKLTLDVRAAKIIKVSSYRLGKVTVSMNGEETEIELSGDSFLGMMRCAELEQKGTIVVGSYVVFHMNGFVTVVPEEKFKADYKLLLK